MGLMFVATVPYMDSHVHAFSGKACVRLMLHDRCAMPLCKPNTSFAFFLILLGVVGGRRSENPCDRDAFTGLFRVQTQMSDIVPVMVPYAGVCIK